MMMQLDDILHFQAQLGGFRALHGRFASRTGWIGASHGAGAGDRRLATLIAAVPGSSVPNGRRLRS
jgi:hypothetical protein